jgi:hypothetical protein
LALALEKNDEEVNAAISADKSLRKLQKAYNKQQKKKKGRK